jgi:hypothetical protein
MAQASVALLTIALFAAFAHAQDTTDPAARVMALADATQRAAAHRDLVAFGGNAVPALIDGLRAKDETAVAEVTAILQEIGPDAGKAVPALKSRIETKAATLPTLRALVELVPYRDADVTLGDRWLSPVLLGLHHLGDNDAEAMVLTARLVARSAFAVDLDVGALIRTARSSRSNCSRAAVRRRPRRSAISRRCCSSRIRASCSPARRSRSVRARRARSSRWRPTRPPRQPRAPCSPATRRRRRRCHPCPNARAPAPRRS